MYQKLEIQEGLVEITNRARAELERIEARLQQHADPRPRPLTYQITADLFSLSPIFPHWEKVLGTRGTTVEHVVLYAARRNG